MKGSLIMSAIVRNEDGGKLR